MIAVRGPKTNHKKGIKAAQRARRRAEAEERQRVYDAKPLEEKINTAGKKQLRRLMSEHDLTVENGDE